MSEIRSDHHHAYSVCHFSNQKSSTAANKKEALGFLKKEAQQIEKIRFHEPEIKKAMFVAEQNLVAAKKMVKEIQKEKKASSSLKDKVLLFLSRLGFEIGSLGHAKRVEKIFLHFVLENTKKAVQNHPYLSKFYVAESDEKQHQHLEDLSSILSEMDAAVVIFPTEKEIRFFSVRKGEQSEGILQWQPDAKNFSVHIGRKKVVCSSEEEFINALGFENEAVDPGQYSRSLWSISELEFNYPLLK